MGAVANFGRSALDPMDHFRDPRDPNAGQKYMAKPEDAKFVGMTNEDGSLADRFKMSDGSAYTDIANQRLASDVATGRDQAAAQAGGAAASARNSIASRGGLSGGMAALLARNMQSDLMNANQGITSKQIGAGQDIQAKQFAIGREAETSNVGALRGNQAALNEFTQNKYASDMGAWGANNTANAQLAVANKPKTGLAKLTGK
jgi:hypothetical protein